MWKILKADFDYNIDGLMVLYGIGISLFIAGFIWDSFDVNLLSGITIISYWVIIGNLGKREDNEKRDRFITLLPIPIRQIGRARNIYLITVQSGLFLLWLISLWLNPLPTKEIILRDLISLNALVFVFMIPFIIFHDLGYFGKRIYRFTFTGGILFLLIFLIWLDLRGIIKYPFQFGEDHVKSTAEIGSYYLVVTGLFYWNHIVFIRRKSYVE